jgi:FKBP-type peptidyl-prolyl cis-trans isomerase FkpA
MTRLLVSLILAGFAVVGTACAAEPELKTEDDKMAYTLGLFLAGRGQISSFGFTPAQLEMLKAGIMDGATGAAPKLDLQTYLPKLQEYAKDKMAAAAAATAVIEKKKGKEFLATIAAKEGIKKTGTGLLMKVTEEGTGASAVSTDIVKVNYKGSTIDGKVFDASERRGGPATLNLGEVVKCWIEALEFIKVGGKATIYCPPDLAWGDAGRGADIPPGAAIFDIELLGIVKPAPPRRTEVIAA